MSKQWYEQFDEMHIRLVWQVLEDHFGFNVKIWKSYFEEYKQKRGRGLSSIAAFHCFGHDHINPILNQVLGRLHGHPTFDNLCHYVVSRKRVRTEPAMRRKFDG